MIVKGKTYTFIGIFLILFSAGSAFAQKEMNHSDSVEIISRSERLISEEYQRLLNTITTGSDEDAHQSIIYSYTSSSGIRCIFQSENIVVENDLDSSYYRGKKKNLFISDYLNQFWTNNVGAGKQIAYLSGIVCDSLYRRGDSVTATVFFNTVFDKKPFFITKHKAHITAKKVENDWVLSIYEILFNDYDQYKKDLVVKFKSDLKEEKSTPFLIPEKDPVYYFTYKKKTAVENYTDVLERANTKFQAAELAYYKYLFEDAEKKYSEVNAIIPDHDFIKKRIENCNILSRVLPANIDTLFNKYRNAFERRNFIKAQIYLDSANTLQPDNSKLQKCQAELNEAQTEYNQAKKQLETNPDNFQEYINKRLLAKDDYSDIYYFFLAKFHMSKDNASALADLDKALKKKPLFTEARKLNVKALLVAVDCDKALNDIRQLMVSEPKSDTLFAMHAEALACSDQKKEAIAEYTYAIQLDSTNYEYYLNRGNTYFALKNLDLALADLKKAIALKPDYAEANKYLFEIYYKELKKEDSAFVFLDQAMKSGLSKNDIDWNVQESKRRYEMGKGLLQRRAMKEAGDNFRYAANLDNSNHDAWYQSARIDSSELKNFKRANRSMLNALKLQPNNIEYLLLAGRIQNADSQYDAAITNFETISQRSKEKPDLKNAYEGIGDAYSGKKMDNRAQNFYKQALENDPKNFSLSFKLANSYLEGFNFDEGIDLYKKIINNYTSGNDIAYFKIGQCYEGKKDYSSAIKSYSKVLENKPNYPEANYRLGVNYKKDGNCKKAIEGFNNEIHLNPRHLEAILEMADCQYQLGQFAEAIKTYSQLIQMDENKVKKESKHCEQFAHACLHDKLFYNDALTYITYGEKNYSPAYFQYLKGEYYYLTGNQDKYTEAKKYFEAYKLVDLNRIKNDNLFKDLAKQNQDLKLILK